MMTCTAPTNSAPISRKSPASEAITTISDNALLIGCFCASRLMAPATHPAAKTKNRISCNIRFIPAQFAPKALFQAQRYDQGGHHHVGDGERQQELPAERHQLVITETGQRTAHPDV